jgi:hypothetical protein
VRRVRKRGRRCTDHADGYWADQSTGVKLLEDAEWHHAVESDDRSGAGVVEQLSRRTPGLRGVDVLYRRGEIVCALPREKTPGSMYKALG